MTRPDNTGPLASMLPAEKRAVGVIALIGTLRMFGLFALLPVLPLYAATLEGATPTLIGLVVGAYGLTQAALQIPLGALSDRIGRVPVIVGGLLVFAIGSVLAATSDSISGVIAGRLLQGAGAISATLTALIADATRDGVRTRSMAIYGVGVGGAFILGFGFGPRFADAFGVPVLFLLVAFLAVIAGASLLLLPSTQERLAAPTHWNFRRAARPELLRLDLYIFLLHTIMTALVVALPFLFVDRLEIGLGRHWQMWVGALVVSLVVAVPLIIRDDRRGAASAVGIAVMLVLAGLAVLTFTGIAVAPVFAGLVLFFAGFSFLEAALPARVSRFAADDGRGASLGVFASSQFLGAFAGGLVGGRFLAAGRPADVFFVCMLLALFWLALHGFGRSRDQG